MIYGKGHMCELAKCDRKSMPHRSLRRLEPYNQVTLSGRKKYTRYQIPESYVCLITVSIKDTKIIKRSIPCF